MPINLFPAINRRGLTSFIFCSSKCFLISYYLLGDSMKKYLIAIGYILISFIILTFIVTLLNYFDVATNNTLKLIKIVVPIISMLLGSIYLGLKSDKKGYLEGIKLGIIMSFIFFIFSFLGLDKNLSFSRMIYYIIIIITSMLGGMIGISKKSLD